MHPDNSSSELRVQFVTELPGVIALIGAYWLGTSFSSQRKTELQACGARLPGYEVFVRKGFILFSNSMLHRI